MYQRQERWKRLRVAPRGYTIRALEWGFFVNKIVLGEMILA